MSLENLDMPEDTRRTLAIPLEEEMSFIQAEYPQAFPAPAASRPGAFSCPKTLKPFVFVEVYSMQHQTWSPVASYPQPIEALTAMAYGPYIYAAGGSGAGRAQPDAVRRLQRCASDRLLRHPRAIPRGPRGHFGLRRRHLPALQRYDAPPAGAYTFADVPPAFPFFGVIETAAAATIVSGYGCGGPGEPCDGQHRPYFRPYADVTRGQLAKIVVAAAGWVVQHPATGTFVDVAPGSTFYPCVQTAVCRGVISGYADHTFRSGNTTIRGQISKIVYLSITVTGGCPPAPGARYARLPRDAEPQARAAGRG